MPQLHFPDLDLRLNTQTGKVDSREGDAALSPRSLQLLLYLIENHDRVVPRDELLREVWDGVHVSDAAVRQGLRLLRRELEPAGVTRDAILTIRGRGVRWNAGAPHTSEPASTLSFVGRDRELTELLELLESARAGHEQRVLISGPAGIGKTRLLQELCTRAEQRGFAVATARCADVEGSPPLHPWDEILRSLAAQDGELLSRLPAADAGAVAATFPTLAGDFREHAVVEPNAGRMRLFEAVRRFLDECSARRPILLAVDDLHRADGASLRLLEWLSEHLRSRRLLLVVTFREEEDWLAEGVADLLARLRGSDGRQIELLPLDRAGVVSAARTALSTNDEDTLARIWKRSGGNPFLMRVAIAESRRRGPDAALSVGAREAVLQTLAALSSGARRVLAAAAAGGDEIRTKVLAGVVGLAPEALEEALEELIEARHLDWRSDHSLGFSHALVAEAMLQSQSAHQRARLHARWAQQLETLSEPAATIAEHAFQGRSVLGDVPVAQACREAAEEAAQRFAFEEAARHYARAAECLADEPNQVLLPVLQELGEMRARVEGATGVRELADRVIAIAKEMDDPEAIARAVQSLAIGRGVSSDRPDIAWIHQLEEALAVYRRPTPLRARLLSELAEALWFSDEQPRARALVLESLELVERSGDADAILPILNRAYRILITGTRDEDVRREICARIDAMIPETHDRGVVVEAIHTRFWESTVRGDLAGIHAFAGRIEREYEAVGGLHARWWTVTARTALAFLEGRLQDAEAAALENLALGQKAGIGAALPNHATQMISIRAAQGRLPEIESLLLPMHGAMPENPGWSVSLEMTRLAAGRVAPAREFLRAFCLEERFGALRDDVSRLPVISMLTDMATTLGEEEVAAALLTLVDGVPEQHLVVAAGFCHWGSLAGLRGRLFAAVGDWDAAIDHLELGLARDRAIRAVLSVARDEIHLARALESRGRAEDRRRARELLASGRALARDLGAREGGDLL